MDRNVVITGFMGSGKTTTGKLLAERLEAPFVDMDRVIEERMGLTIAEIFGCYGESFFRKQESLLALELSQSAGRVIATGGGTLICDANRRALGHNGTIINLGCTAEEVLRRLQDETDRPLLAGPDRLERTRSLLKARQSTYAAIACQVDTTSLTAEEVVERILDILREQRT